MMKAWGAGAMFKRSGGCERLGERRNWGAGVVAAEDNGCERAGGSRASTRRMGKTRVVTPLG